MLANPFDELLCEFQAGYAEFGDELFHLFALDRDELAAHREGVEANAAYLGFVPLGDDAANPARTPGFSIYGPTRKNRWGKWTERWERPFQTIKNLAARAGAALPTSARRIVRFEPADPVGWWLAYMWWRKPPTNEDLRPPDGEQRKTRVIWAEPFLDSMEAIEGGGLCSPRPALSAAAKAGPLRDAIQDLLIFSSDPPKTSAQETELGSAWHAIDALTATPIQIVGTDPVVWTNALRQAAWAVKCFAATAAKGEHPTASLLCLKNCQDELVTSVGSDEEPASGAEKCSLRVTEAAQVSGLNRGVISRAADTGELKSNGKRGSQRRIDAVSLTRLTLRRLGKPDAAESDAKVASLVARHVPG